MHPPAEASQDIRLYGIFLKGMERGGLYRTGARCCRVEDDSSCADVSGCLEPNVCYDPFIALSKDAFKCNRKEDAGF